MCCVHYTIHAEKKTPMHALIAGPILFYYPDEASYSILYYFSATVLARIKRDMSLTTTTLAIKSIGPEGIHGDRQKTEGRPALATPPPPPPPPPAHNTHLHQDVLHSAMWPMDYIHLVYFLGILPNIFITC